MKTIETTEYKINQLLKGSKFRYGECGIANWNMYFLYRKGIFWDTPIMEYYPPRYEWDRGMGCYTAKITNPAYWVTGHNSTLYTATDEECKEIERLTGLEVRKYL